MTAELVPVRLTLTSGDRYTLWAPLWRDGGDEWEGFLGKDEDLYGFDSAADLAAFVRTSTDNDLIDHPSWETLTRANAHTLDPDKAHHYDLIAVEELLAAKPNRRAVETLGKTMAVVASIGSVCELTPVTKLFNGNPALGALASGFSHFSGRAGRKQWGVIGDIIGRNWEAVLNAVDDAITTPPVDAAASGKAAEELAGPAPDTDAGALTADDEAPQTPAEASAHAAPAGDEHVVLGSDKAFWEKVGIDPIQIMTSTGTFYSLRCYLGEEPVFLGRNGRVSVFGSERALARYLADEHDHDLSDLPTYDDIRTAATDGSLRIDVTDDNVYVLTGLRDDLADGPDAVDDEQLALTVELLRDIGTYAEDDIVAETLAVDRPLGAMIDYALDGERTDRPGVALATAVKEWEQLEQFVESRLRHE